MFTHNDIIIIEESYNKIKENSPETLYYFKYKYPDLSKKIQNLMIDQDIKIINDKEVLNELNELAKSTNNILDSNYKIKPFSEINEVRIVLKKSLNLLKKTHPWMYRLYEIFDIIFIPIEKDGGTDGSGSSAQLFGYITMTLYNRHDNELDIVMLASAIAHEISHHVLSMYDFYDDIIINKNIETRSPIRKTLRPILCSLHACIAASYIITVLLDYKSENQDVISKIKNYSIDILKHLGFSLKEIIEKAEFTELGRTIYNEIFQNYKKYSHHIY